MRRIPNEFYSYIHEAMDVLRERLACVCVSVLGVLLQLSFVCNAIFVPTNVLYSFFIPYMVKPQSSIVNKELDVFTVKKKKKSALRFRKLPSFLLSSFPRSLLTAYR